MNDVVRLSALCGLLLVTASAFAADVVVNGVPLEESARKSFEQKYGVPIKPGRYWYDNVSGVSGREGGPGAGQIHAGLQLGGPLRRNASKGHTGVIVNGREFHALDVAALQRCLVVVPGRYWVLANGVGGVEGGPPQLISLPCAAVDRRVVRARSARTTGAADSTAVINGPVLASSAKVEAKVGCLSTARLS